MSLPRSDLNLSRFLSYLLRHRPEDIDLKLDEEGWAQIDDLIEKSRGLWPTLSREKIKYIVEIDDKSRFSCSPDGTKIRASQGHSSREVKMQLEQHIPPTTLYHGTATKFLQSINEHGLRKQQRHHVHLSNDVETALMVGQRRDENPVILIVDAGAMHRAGHEFFLSDNNVWLVDDVPPQYLSTQDVAQQPPDENVIDT